MNDAVVKISGTLTSAILALCLFPDVQTTAQDEIDAVVGTSRSPTWDDFDAGRFPYVSALAKEILRWRSVTELGSATEASLRNHIYRGYCIPKGARLLCNVWALHRDPQEFPDPGALKPERFLGDEEGGLAFIYPDLTGHNAFGWGPALARLLWAFDIRAGTGENVSTHQPFGTVHICRHTWTSFRN